MQSNIIVALDHNDVHKNEALYYEIRDQVDFFKVGNKILYQRYGREFCEHILNKGDKLFLDVKLYDTIDTVSEETAVLMELEPTFMTVKGEYQILKSTFDIRNEYNSSTKILAVPSLTDGEIYGRIFIKDESVFDGIVCHPFAANYYKEIYGTFTVCPGIRLNTDKDNHVYSVIPKEAVERGADYLVIGRPIYLAKNPSKALKEIIESLNENSG